MMKIYLDANFLIYFKIEDMREHENAVHNMKEIVKRSSVLAISSLVIDEFLHAIKRVLMHHKKSEQLVKQALNEIFMLPKLEIIEVPKQLEVHKNVVDYMHDYNLKPRDAYHLLCMMTNGIDCIATYDTDFATAFEKGIVKQAW